MLLERKFCGRCSMCFYGIDDLPTFTTTDGKSCVIDRELRKECGYKGIDKAECEGKGCCWKIDDYESIIPWCFHGVVVTNQKKTKNKFSLGNP